MTPERSLVFGNEDLLPMLKPQPGVCEICRQWCEDATRCHSCQRNMRVLQLDPVAVLPISLAVKRGQLATALWKYKSDPDEVLDDAARDIAFARLLTLVDDFMPRHEQCLAAAAGVEHFNWVTWVPTRRDPAMSHTLPSLLERSSWAAGYLEEGVRFWSSDVLHRDASPRKFSATPEAKGWAALLFDDTWTTGAHALSAVRALRDRGATQVAVAVIGRHFVPSYRSCSVYAEEADQTGFDIRYCALCDPRPKASPPLPHRVTPW